MNEAKESEDIPQIPCPEVHPFESLDPKPTKTPPKSNLSGDTFVCICSAAPKNKNQIPEPTISPKE